MRLDNKRFQIVLSDFDIGAGTKGAADGPGALLNALDREGISFDGYRKLNDDTKELPESKHPFCKHIDEVLLASVKLNDTITDIVKAGKIPMVFSGDHSNAIGGISGLKNADPSKRIGVIWIDAHADLHSPFTTPSGNMHGMPLAVLSGTDNESAGRNRISDAERKEWNELKKIGTAGIEPKIDIKDIVFIGIRDAEQEEWQLIEDNGLMVFEPQDIKEHGIYHALNNAIARLQNCDLIYVSFDVDSLDPGISTGTGTTAPNGLKIGEAEAVFKTCLDLPNLGAFEITEINPKLDGKGRKMADVIAGIMKNINY